MDLSGKVLVVTGSDGVLGQAVVATLSRYGARLISDALMTLPELSSVNLGSVGPMSKQR